MMKRWFRALLCAAALVATISASAFAAEPGLLISPAPVPERQGDFYVLVNGEYVTFTDAVPKIKNDRSCLPFVAVFDQLGFAEEDMTWDGETKTVTATKDGLTISLTIGRPEITLIRDGETTVIPTDVAPYIEPALSRTYVPFGLVADALGYNVGWDTEQRAVLIDDVDAILANNTATYELMDKYLDYGRTFQSKNYSVTGDYYVELYSTEPAEDGSTLTSVIYYGGDYEMLTKAGNSAFQFKGDMELDMAFYQDDQDISELMKAIMLLGGLELPITVEMEQRGDTATGMLYSYPASDYMLGGDPVPGGTWEMESLSASPYGMFLYTPDSILSQEVGVSFEGKAFLDVIREMMLSLPLTDCNYTCTQYLTELNALYADNSFQKNGSTYTSYTEDNTGYGGLTLYTSAGKVTGYGLDMVMWDEMDSLMEVSTVLEDNELYTIISYLPNTVDGASVDAGMTLEMTGTYKATSKSPVTAPPVGAVIIDLTAGAASAE